MKKYTRARRTTTFRRRKRTTKRSSKFARRQQKSASTWIRKKYTKTFLIEAEQGADSSGWTVSLIGGKNNQTPALTITLADVNQDNQLSTDMRLYQFFRIRGVATKMFFPMPTNADASPAQWSMSYSASDILAPALPVARLQTMAAYQTGPCSQEKSISRFYNTANAYRRFGIQYCSTSEFPNFSQSVPLYGGQLQSDQGSSQLVRVFRNGTATTNALARFEVTYYVTYKGQKGASSLTVT